MDMKYSVFSENEWVYPDSTLGCAVSAALDTPRGGDACLQLLTDTVLGGGEELAVKGCGLPKGVTLTAYRLLPVNVAENSGPKLFCTKNYDEVKDFVTRQAPFGVYDITEPLSGKTRAGRLALWLRLDAAADALPGAYDFRISVKAGENNLSLPVLLTVHAAKVPPLADAKFGMVNWVYCDPVAADHGVEAGSDDFFRILREYFANQTDMRNTHFMIPAGKPVRDVEGKVVDFDFTLAEAVAREALDAGLNYVMGGFTARFKEWNDPDMYLLWDREVGVTGIEGFRQLKLYYTRAWESVCRMGIADQYYQCLVDEPQFPNSLAYRAMSGICRSCMPGVKIHDPVETTDIGGALDVWVVKQAVYEKHIENFRALQSFGEEMWLYTCGFPAGKTMNRCHDLPLTVSRLTMWMCILYRCTGFLHWGYHRHSTKPGEAPEACYSISGGRMYPPGNSYVVYPAPFVPGSSGYEVAYGVRGHLQRTGAQDAELLMQLGEAEADELIKKVCTSFNDYTGDAALFDRVRRELLIAVSDKTAE